MNDKALRILEYPKIIKARQLVQEEVWKGINRMSDKNKENLPESASDFEFLQEKIKERPINKMISYGFKFVFTETDKFLFLNILKYVILVSFR